MTLRTCGIGLRPWNTTTLTEIDVCEVARVSTKGFSSLGALCDDQSSTEIKRGMFTAHTSQQTESTTQQHLAGIFNNALHYVS